MSAGKRDEGLPTILYLIVFRRQQSGMNQRVVGSISNLINFIEVQDEDERRGLVRPDGYDIYYVDLESLEIAVYDTKDLKALLRSPKGRKQ